MKKHIISILVLFLLLSTSFVGVSNQCKEQMIDAGRSKILNDGGLMNSSWPMFHHDVNHSGYSTSIGPNTNNVLWTYTTNDSVTSSPAVADGKVYFGCDNNKVYCLDAETGVKLWNFITGNLVHSSPAVANGKVYVGSTDDKVYCLDAETGIKIWDYSTVNTVGSSPAVVNGRLYVGAGSKVYCLDAETGATIWNYTTDTYMVHSSPAVTNGKVFFGCGDHNVYCLNAETGVKIWNYTTGDPVSSSPAVADGKIFIGSSDHQVYSFDAETGVKIWNYTTYDDVHSTPAVADGKVYIGSYQELYCLNAFTGTIIWEYPIGYQAADSSPAVAEGMIYFGCSDNNVYCLDAGTGVKIWNYTTYDDIESSPAIADGKVYIGSRDGTLYCFGMANPPPNPPNITGPHYGKTNTIYTFSIGSPTDPNGDQFYAMWDWGDGYPSGWLGPFNSWANGSHAWNEPGNYTIKVKIKDMWGAGSNWSAPFFITIVKLKPACFLGSFESCNQTADLLIMKGRTFIVFPSHPIFHKRETLVISKQYLGPLGTSFILGVGGVAILQ